MRKGINSLARQVQETLGRDPNGGDLFVFRGKRGDTIKMIWHDGLGMSLYIKRLERGDIHLADGRQWRCVDHGGAAQLHVEGIDWRNPVYTFRPALAG